MRQDQIVLNVSASMITEEIKSKLRSPQMRSCLFLVALRGILPFPCIFRILRGQVCILAGLLLELYLLVIPEFLSAGFSTAEKGVLTLTKRTFPHEGSCVPKCKNQCYCRAGCKRNYPPLESIWMSVISLYVNYLFRKFF